MAASSLVEVAAVNRGSDIAMCPVQFLQRHRLKVLKGIKGGYFFSNNYMQVLFTERSVLEHSMSKCHEGFYRVNILSTLLNHSPLTGYMARLGHEGVGNILFRCRRCTCKLCREKLQSAVLPNAMIP